MLDINDNVLADINRGFFVPAQPKLLIKLQQLMTANEPDLNKIATTISQDVSVAATVLKTINSPVYGLSRTISDIHKSVRYIGLDGVVSLVTYTLIKSSFKQADCNIALEEFWDNATNIANVCVEIGNTLKQAVSKDTLFSLGLFHDCGVPAMAMKYENYNDIYTLSNDKKASSLIEIEEKHYHVNHAIIGYYVASSWRLPKEICQLILSHHDRNFLREENSRIQKFYFSILKMAENIVYYRKNQRDSADWPIMRNAIFKQLDISNDDYQMYLEEMAELQA
ncbi:MAG: HD-like signal output (HDOD) protein [Alteromonadaceae bacterium]|jgi:HD-like signal output (HDOD) protein